MLGMMVHQDGSSHEWVPGRWWDLIVTMDDVTIARSTRPSSSTEEGTMSRLAGLSEAIRQGPCSARYADRASHYWHTPEAGGKVD